MARTKHQTHAFPTREQLLAFIKDHAGKAGTREIARAFGLKNADRAELKRVLRDLADEGAVENARKKLHKPGTLPSVTLADITARDRDGELIAVPTEWDEEAHGEAPHILIANVRAGQSPAKPRASATARCFASTSSPNTKAAPPIPVASSRCSTAPRSA